MAGIAALVINGTTAETPTLSYAEQERTLRMAITAAKGRVPIIAGTGSNSTAYTLEQTRLAQKLGAQAALIVAPYYNKPTPEGLYQHFRTIHDGCDLPIILYNIPGRSGVDMSNALVARLAELPRIIGLKDATADLTRPLNLRSMVPTDFALYSGEDALIAGYLAQGGHGCISVSSNVVPAECVALYQAWQAQNWPEFARLRDLLAPLHAALFCETNPAPTKYALARLGLLHNELRLPLVSVSPASEAVLNKALQPFMSEAVAA